MRILCLTAFPTRPPADRWIWNHLPEQGDTVDFLSVDPSDSSKSWGKLLSRYPQMFTIALQAVNRIRRNPYDLVVAWESIAGIPAALVFRTLRRSRPPLLILGFNPGDVPQPLRPLFRAALARVNGVAVITRYEVEEYARRFHLPADRIRHFFLPAYDIMNSPSNAQDRVLNTLQTYIHASGRSARDYRTLVQAVDGLDVKVIVHGRGYNFQSISVPANVQIGDLAPSAEYSQLVRNALFEIVPLQYRSRPVGSSQIVWAMMMGKAVIATRTPMTTEYVDEGKTGLLVEPGDVSDMRRAVKHLLDCPELAEQMGRAARERFERYHTYEAFARRAREIMKEVASEVRR